MIEGRILALSGGVGGAKLASGLADVLPAGQLTVVANTGDDFEYLGLHISPDIDSLVYALAGVNNQETGWGRAAESWTFMAELERLGIDSWFRLGDRDLAVHVYRSAALKSGDSLSSVTRDLCERFGVAARVVPMSEAAVRTVVNSNEGRLSFQEYFVRRQCRPVVTEIEFDGAGGARPSPGFAEALGDPSLAGIVICPSNPWLSVDPILSIPGVATAISRAAVPVVAVSPIVAGRSIKGPTAKIMSELGIAVSATSVAEHYRSIAGALVLDTLDAALEDDIVRLGMAVEVHNTVMRMPEDRSALARCVVNWLARLGRADLR